MSQIWMLYCYAGSKKEENQSESIKARFPLLLLMRYQITECVAHTPGQGRVRTSDLEHFGDDGLLLQLVLVAQSHHVGVQLLEFWGAKAHRAARRVDNAVVLHQPAPVRLVLRIQRAR